MDRFAERRLLMVERDLIRRGIRDTRVLTAMSRVPRHLFLPPGLAEQAYLDEPLPISNQQTISQPYIVALMAEALLLKPADRLLEVGAGSGYAAAVASELCAEVYTIERHPELAAHAQQVLAELGYANVQVRCGDGTQGWPEHAPFDAISVTAAGSQTPAPLLAQLAPHGRLLMPVGDEDDQTLVRVIDGRAESLLGVRFVPLVSAPA